MQCNKLFIKLYVISLFLLKATSYRCDRIPSDLIADSNSNIRKYVLEIEGKPDQYVPDERYEVTIKEDTLYSSYKFKKFIVTLESKPNGDDGEEVTHQTGKLELGNDGLSKFSDTCKDTVVEANTQSKKQVTLIWKAPSSNSGCVSVRATVIESREKWYADDEAVPNGYLTKTLCEDFNENDDVLPEVLEYCCACDEAKYEMAFQGNWIRNTHPRGFPEDLWTTKFGDIIGASHKNNQEFWADGSEPSAGLKELAFNGSTRTLESELMGNIANIHTIIKARGLAYPNITSLSYAVFRADNENHLVSVVTKMMPSPDWIVGVSGLELCLSNCSWKMFKTINLYPRDVGIDDGLYYTDSKPPSNDNPTITEITPSDPADPKSPFYDESGEKIKPIAKLHFKLEKIYRKECDPDREIEETSTSGCGEVIGWGKWSGCSVECGKGHMTRNVQFKNCIEREETQECQAPCESGEKVETTCDHYVWGKWSKCSVTCGKGFKERNRMPSSHYEEDATADVCPSKEVVECNERDC